MSVNSESDLARLIARLEKQQMILQPARKEVLKEVTPPPEQLFSEDDDSLIEFKQYENETVLPEIMELMAKDLSEPYSIYTYRYFLVQWPNLCILAYDTKKKQNIGAVICREEVDHRRGYIAMLAVHSDYRRQGIASKLVVRVIETMKTMDCDEVGLETEVTNEKALKLYGKLGFIREQRMRSYYLNGVDAFRLKLSLKSKAEQASDAVYELRL